MAMEADPLQIKALDLSCKPEPSFLLETTDDEEASQGWSDSDSEEDTLNEIKHAMTKAAPSKPFGDEDSPVLFKKPKVLLTRSRIEQVKQGFRRSKSNSTSSLYINNTMSSPSLDQVLWCTATAIFYHLQEGHATKEPIFFSIFNELDNPISDERPNPSVIPPLTSVYKFFNSLFTTENLPSECAILTLAYIERLIHKTGISIHATNWRRICLSGLILASKVWEDQAVWNVDFLSVFPDIDVNDLKKLEKYFLEFLRYDVSLSASVYAKYYFELRVLAEQNSKHFPLEPLTNQKASELERRTQYCENKARARLSKLHRTSSSDALPLKSPRMILN